MEESKRILFLGFGFAEPNILKLGLERVRQSPTTDFFASAVNLTPSDQERIRKYLPHIQFFGSIEDIIDKL